jgi:hypothetical protein
MGDDDALHSEMRRLQGLTPAEPPPLDPDTAERMLVGAVDPADAPPGYAAVVRVLAAATAGPTAAELAGEEEVVAAFSAVRRPLAPVRRKPVLGSLVSVKALVAAAAGVVTIGTAAAAATGALPDRAQEVAHRLVAGVPAPAESVRPASSGPSSDASSNAGLCRAWAAGQGGEHGKKLDATAFRGLATAAGGAGEVAGYCSALTGAATPRSAQQNAGQSRPRPADQALTGLCVSWLAADQHDQTDRLGKVVQDRLTAAAGGADKVTAYCTAAVARADAGTRASVPTADHPAPSIPAPAPPVDHQPGGGVTAPTPPTHR